MADLVMNFTRTLTDAGLAERLRNAADRARSFTAAEREALLREAARRLEGVVLPEEFLAGLAMSEPLANLRDIAHDYGRHLKLAKYGSGGHMIERPDGLYGSVQNCAWCHIHNNHRRQTIR